MRYQLNLRLGYLFPLPLPIEPTPGFNNKVPEAIMTPDKVDTRIGTLEFF